MEDASLNPSGETDNSKERITAKKLALRHGLIVKHALYSKKHDSNGRNWYHILKQFPAARLDDNGYIIFITMWYTLTLLKQAEKTEFMKTLIKIN